MYLAGVSVRREEDITEALWGTRCPPARSRTSTRRFTSIWALAHPENRRQSLPTSHLDGLVLKRRWGGEIKNVSVLAAIGVDGDGYRRIPSVSRKATR